MNTHRTAYRAIEPNQVQAWLYDGQELAFLDVREHGQYGEAHPLFVTSLPYSRLELDIARLVPRLSTRLVLIDDDETVARKAAERALAAGYKQVFIVRGGTAAWKEQGYELFAGVNVPSKTFGELVEQVCATPSISARALSRRMAAGDDLIVLDGRPYDEYRKMNIPGSICCPNGELAYRIHALAPAKDTTIVINCAGRTRSIIGAQTLLNLNIPNPVLALENGTQGWFLEGLALEHGSDRKYPDVEPCKQALERAQHLAAQLDVAYVDALTVADWQATRERSVFLCDVRTAEEFSAGTLPGAQHAPGGQLIQATDHYVGVRGARIVVFDDQGSRAPVIAGWLRQMGHDACVLSESIADAADILSSATAVPGVWSLPALTAIEAGALHDQLQDGAFTVVDVRPSADYRAAHVPGAVWSIRPRIAAQLQENMKPVVFIADDPRIAALAASEVGTPAFFLQGGMAAWREAGLPLAATPHTPPDEQRIDYLFFVHDRHDGNREAALRYLAWETGLLEQLEPRERASFRPVRLAV